MWMSGVKLKWRWIVYFIILLKSFWWLVPYFRQFKPQYRVNLYNSQIKGTLSVSGIGPTCKDDYAWFNTVPLTLCLINNVEDIVVLLGLKVFNSDIFYNFSCRRYAQVTFEERNHNWKKIRFQVYKQWYLIHTWSDNYLNANVMNQALQSL